MVDILSKEDKQAIEKALEDAKVLRQELARAKRAGLDVSDIERELTEAEQKLRSIHRVYVKGG